MWNKPDRITASQFEKLGRFSALTRPHFTKTDYAILFKEFNRDSESNYMSLEEFFSAMEAVFSKLYHTGDLYENMEEYLSNAEAVLK